MNDIDMMRLKTKTQTLTNGDLGNEYKLILESNKIKRASKMVKREVI